MKHFLVLGYLGVIIAATVAPEKAIAWNETMDCSGKVVAIRSRGDGTGKVCFKSTNDPVAANGNWQCMGTDITNSAREAHLSLLLTAKTLDQPVSWKQAANSTSCYNGVSADVFILQFGG